MFVSGLHFKKGNFQMPFRWIFFALFTIILLSMSWSAGLWAGDQYGWIGRRYYGPVPYYVGNPKLIEPSPSAAGTISMRSCPPQQSIAGPRAYPYGYFGAQYRPYTNSRRYNYYQDYSQWSFSRGY
jgi:hypothetical protein